MQHLLQVKSLCILILLLYSLWQPYCYWIVDIISYLKIKLWGNFSMKTQCQTLQLGFNLHHLLFLISLNSNGPNFTSQNIMEMKYSNVNEYLVLFLWKAWFIIILKYSFRLSIFKLLCYKWQKLFWQRKNWQFWCHNIWTPNQDVWWGKLFKMKPGCWKLAVHQINKEK